ncbi:hypothetical protein H0H93_001674 [Arthromyces matolae]|nr:hypothetical protein H0H93_001674 [Arthromyces matolae]
MQSRSFFVAFLTLAISAFTAQAAPSNYYNNFNNEQACSVSVTAPLTDDIPALDPRVIATGFADDGQDVPAAGQVPSLTSTNNFINFCLTVPDLPITNGKQITTGSCNPAPIGVIPSTDNMPSAKFSFPTNFGTIKANTAFTITMNIQNMETGFFVNAQENYFAAPQQLNAQGQIQGHSHVVVEQIASLDQTSPTDPQKFAFFKGLNAAAANGQLTADVTAGLPAGVYRLASINTSANHAPVIVPVAQHGSLDDAIYFTVTDDGNPVGGAASAAATSDAVSATASATDSVSATASDSASVAASTGTSASVTGTTSAVASETASASATDSASASASATSVAATATATAGSSSKNGKKNKSDKNSSAAASSTDAAATSTATATSSSSAASASATAKEASPKKARSLKYRRRNF